VQVLLLLSELYLLLLKVSVLVFLLQFLLLQFLLLLLLHQLFLVYLNQLGQLGVTACAVGAAVGAGGVVDAFGAQA
jgi:hypothetical protein